MWSSSRIASQHLFRVSVGAVRRFNPNSVTPTTSKLLAPRRANFSTNTTKKLGSRAIAKQMQASSQGPKSSSGPSSQVWVAIGAVSAVIGAGTWICCTESGNQVLAQVPAAKSAVDSVKKAWNELGHPTSENLLPDLPELDPPAKHKPTLVLDVEGVLMATEWDRHSGWRAVKRPHVDLFLQRIQEYYEVVLFTTGLHVLLGQWTKQLNALTPEGKPIISYELYRDSTKMVDGEYIKDLTYLNRDLSRVIIVDDEPIRFKLQPENGVAIKPFTDKNDTTDRTLLDLKAFLEDLILRDVQDFREEIAKYKGKNIPEEFHKREEEQLRQMVGTKPAAAKKGWF